MNRQATLSRMGAPAGRTRTHHSRLCGSFKICSRSEAGATRRVLWIVWTPRDYDPGRLSGAERCKGIDEVLESMPSLVQEMLDLIYLILGDGMTAARLQSKARALGVDRNVVIAGYVAEEERVTTTGSRILL